MSQHILLITITLRIAQVIQMNNVIEKKILYTMDDKSSTDESG